MTTFALFLRGINVGGHHKVPMADLRACLEDLGFENPRTLLASGNVLVDAKSMDDRKIASALESKFGFPVPVISRTAAHLRKLESTDPFAGVGVTKDTRRMVTFLSEPPKSKKAPTTLPGFEILSVTNTEVFSVLQLDQGSGSVDAMSVIEKMSGGPVTTRNWNTVEKLLAKV